MDGEPSALARRGLDINVAAHEFGEPADDRGQGQCRQNVAVPKDA
jgi:hypothetical protein